MKRTARLSGMMERLPPTPEPLSSGFLKIRHVEQFGRRFRQPELRLPQYPSKDDHSWAPVPREGHRVPP